MDFAAPKSEPSPDEILETALKLSREQRVRLAGRLLESVDEGPSATELEAVWGEELAKRVEALELGQVELVDAKDVFRRLRQKHLG